MGNRLENAYHIAVGCCLHAALDLRGFDGEGALSQLRAAIQIIEQAKREAERERRATRWVVQPPASAPPREAL